MKYQTHQNLYLKRVFWISSILALLLMFIGSKSEGRDEVPPQYLNHSGQIRAVIDEKKAMQISPFSIRLPQKFDLREYNRVASPHKTTGCASCWSSAATYIMESMLMPKEDFDLSETHMQMSQLHKCGIGAAAEYAAYYLTSWRGPITETDYQHLVLKNSKKARKMAHVQNVKFIPLRQGPLDNQLIKHFINDNGPVYASVGWRGMTNAVNHAYYWPGNSAAHAVALVGWDDHFDKNKFTYSIQGTTYTPAGDGAFIARNNDGTFYYLSYYDGTLGYNSMATFDAEPVTNYKRIYQHDLSGPRNYVGPSDIPDNPPDSNYVPAIFGANVFTALDDENLAAVGFFTHPYPGRAETYDIAVYLDLDNIPINSSGPVATFSVKLPMGGYYTAALPHTVRLTSQQRFSVVVSGHEIGKPVNAAHLSVEQKPFNDPLSVSPDESYISRDGLNWFDLTAVLGKNSSTGEQENIYGNLGIKAYTQELSHAALKRMPHKFPPYTLTVTNVRAPDINCRFDPTCKVAVHDTVTHFTLPESGGDAFLQSRTWPVGKNGTTGEGLTAYLYRVDMRQMAGITSLPCVYRLSVDFGSVWTLDYNVDGAAEQVFVITQGGIGTVGPSNVKKVGSKVVFEFATPVCAGGSIGRGDSSYFFGMASNRSPSTITAQIRDTLGTTQTVAARGPKPMPSTGAISKPLKLRTEIPRNQ